MTLSWSYRARAKCGLSDLGDGTIAVSAPYGQMFIDELKEQVPSYLRAWEAQGKRWLVGAECGFIVEELMRHHFGDTVRAPGIVPVTYSQLMAKVEYIGATKGHRRMDAAALGMVDGKWRIVFPEPVLRQWFKSGAPGERGTLYSTLGVDAKADGAVIRSAYRRMARQWHPDVCHEPDAAEQFKAITRAYEVLLNPIQRRKYDLGLAMQKSLPLAIVATTGNYRAPLTCGYVVVNGQDRLGYMLVSEIQVWADVLDTHGRVMVSSWPFGAKQPTIEWVSRMGNGDV